MEPSGPKPGPSSRVAWAGEMEPVAQNVEFGRSPVNEWRGAPLWQGSSWRITPSPSDEPTQVHRGDQSETRLELKVRKFERSSLDGAFMEPRGYNRLQSAANEAVGETAKTSEISCRGLPPVA